MKPHVLVIGAGPVGLTAASELVRYGISVRIFDKAAHRTDKSKALVLWSRTLELLDRGPNGSSPFLESGAKVNVVNLVTGHGQLMGQVKLSEVDTPYPFALMLPQSETERFMEERLLSLGVRVERQTEVLKFTTTKLGVDAVVRGPGGREENVSADWILGCDGAHSLARHTLAAPFSGKTMDSDWILADIQMTGYTFPDSEMMVCWHPDGAFVIFPISPGRYRIIADLPKTGNTVVPDPTLEQVQAIIDQRGPGGLKAFDPIWLAGFRINGRKVADYRHGRVFLLGDAAHVHSPAGGQGMNTGMQDAFNLAWKLAMVSNGQGGEDLIGSFSEERSLVGDEVLKLADRLTIMGTLRNPFLQKIRNTVGRLLFSFRPVSLAVANSMTEVAIAYSKSPLNREITKSALPGPKPGERVAPAKNEIPFGSGTRPLFAIVTQKNPSIEDLISKYSGVLDPVTRESRGWGGIRLVRPDGYVCCLADDAHDIEKYLLSLGCSPNA